MEKNIVLEPFGRKLIEARARKGLSQRALAQRTGVPQAHISKIEQGRVDLRLSSLLEIARALDLDVQLLPRHALPAIAGAIRAVESDAASAAESRALVTLDQQERTLERIQSIHPNLEAVQKLLPTIKDLRLIRFDPETLKALQRAVAPAQQASQLAANLDTAKLVKLLEQTNRSLRTLRNAHVHARRLDVSQSSAVPAYRLDDEDD